MTQTTEAPPIAWVYDDGGRRAAGWQGYVGDCAARAVSIALQLDYDAVYKRINELAEQERFRNPRKKRSSARNGVHMVTMKKLLEDDFGCWWRPTMFIGSGTTVHLRADELPTGRIITRVSKHYAAVIDGVLHDTDDCSREGTRAVYGYWIAP